MVDLPSRAPVKPKNYAPFDLELFRNQIFTMGLRVQWEMAAECPCVRRTSAFSLGGILDPAVTSNTREPRVDCAMCKNHPGYLYHSAQEHQAVTLTARSNPKLFEQWGEYAEGMVAFSTMPEQVYAAWDRITLIDSVLVYRESFQYQGDDPTSLRYPIVTRLLDLSTGATKVDVLYLHASEPDGTAAPGGVLVKGVDFLVANGRISWINAPSPTSRISASYYANPVYIVIDHPHAGFRDTFIPTKSKVPIPGPFTPLPVQSFGKLEFLGQKHYQ